MKKKMQDEASHFDKREKLVCTLKMNFLWDCGEAT
ncbi:hypothetical protein Pint_33843 [Pistacia integerrima]|uniref:Uncharacterized protein n=1 Tax=Pistacia integerrima TaxID=434235 RepID=A0ACC0X6H7_9ROSI|nr:hypothetical protein Pint_33843 [Pistacia integerrima]